jgi:nicotinamidase-related amidase
MNAIDPSKSALLVMDLQTAVLPRLGAQAGPLLERTQVLLAAARAAHLPVIYIVVGFRPGYPELNQRNTTFVALAKTGALQTLTPGDDIAPEVAPQPGDPIVQKHRVGAFMGTDLDMILRAKGVETLIVAGIATSGVVLSTVRHAADADYQIVVVEDCCADADEEVHRVLTQKVFARHTVATHREVATALA